MLSIQKKLQIKLVKTKVYYNSTLMFITVYIPWIWSKIYSFKEMFSYIF